VKFGPQPKDKAALCRTSYTKGTVRHPIVTQALELLACEVRHTDALASPDAVKDYLRLKLAPKDHEVFAVMFLDAQHRVIETEEMFRGTLTQTSVYPREVVKAALTHNAAAVILAHNHPSGSTTPSRADELLTQTLKAALALVDVRVLDHMVVTTGEVLSMAERGLM
jgi:DNA repair protein RadC